jgi:hypothetical protein
MLNQNIIYIKEWLYKTCATYDTNHKQKFIQKYGLSESDTPTTNAKSLSRSIPSIVSQVPHQRLHDRAGNHVHICESMSLPTQ